MTIGNSYPGEDPGTIKPIPEKLNGGNQILFVASSNNNNRTSDNVSDWQFSL